MTDNELPPNTVPMFAVYDAQVGAYAQPFVSQRVGSAVRAFSDHVNDANTAPHKHPEDFSLHQLGYWNERTGEITGHTPRRIITALECKEK